MVKPRVSIKIIVFFALPTLLFIGLFVHLFIFRTAVVQGVSMSPTIKNEQVIIYNRLSYLFDRPHRGDVVVIDLDGETFIKRIIGLPDETLSYIDQQLYIDEIPYRQTFISDQRSYWTHNINSTYIPEGYFYVMGDNRRNSRDSRNSLGLIAKEDIIGRAELIIYPFNEWQVIY